MTGNAIERADASERHPYPSICLVGCRITETALVIGAAALAWSTLAAAGEGKVPEAFLEAHCFDCHDTETHKGNLDLTKLKPDFTDREAFAMWLKVHDRVELGEMPPKKRKRPPVAETSAALKSLKDSLVAAEQRRANGAPRTVLRRLTRAEYENTVRDLFDLPGIALQGELPADGMAHGFEKNSDALDISHVSLARYIETADRALDMAIATRPKAPTVVKRRISLVNYAGFAAGVTLRGDAVLLKDKKIDPAFPPAAETEHLDQGAHERLGMYETGSSVGLFRNENDSFNPYFLDYVVLYPGRYRIRTSLWGFQWDKGEVLPSLPERDKETVRLMVVQHTGDGRGGQHPSRLLGYFDAPSMNAQEHEVETWLNYREFIGYNVASIAESNMQGKRRLLSFTGPGIACDWLDVEGPLHNVWPPVSHRVLFGDLPLVEFKPADSPAIRAPKRKRLEQETGAARNRPDPQDGIWTARSEQPLADAERLLASFLLKAFRRPVAPDVARQFVAQVEQRLGAGDCFETAMRSAYRTALCAPDFLYHIEPLDKLDDYSLACRLSYFLWNSMPDARLADLARTGSLHKPDVLRAEVERMLGDVKSRRFVEDFLGQWLKLRQIAATDPDRSLYPEFNLYLQDSMVAETRAYFRELIDKDLDARYLVRSDFAMVNRKLALHYGIPGVSGSEIRRVPLPPDCPRGGFLTQAAITKITANGTTTSPVPRGTFVMAKLLGRPPEPPPPNTAAIEPDVRGASTIREQLDKHRADALCAGCHAKIDPPGFALESFDVIGSYRARYRSIGQGDEAPRGVIDPSIRIGFKLGKPVDASGVLPDERTFNGIREYQDLLAANPEILLKNLAQQLAIYSTGRDITFRDREAIAEIVSKTQKKGSGVRTLIHELVQSRLFQTR